MAQSESTAELIDNDHTDIVQPPQIQRIYSGDMAITLPEDWNPKRGGHYTAQYDNDTMIHVINYKHDRRGLVAYNAGDIFEQFIRVLPLGADVVLSGEEHIKVNGHSALQYEGESNGTKVTLIVIVQHVYMHGIAYISSHESYDTHVDKFWDAIDSTSFVTLNPAIRPEPLVRVPGLKIWDGLDVIWSYTDSKGYTYNATTDIRQYEEAVITGAFTSIGGDIITECCIVENTTMVLPAGEEVTATSREAFPILDYTDFVTGEFSSVIDGNLLYERSYSDEDFLFEVWYVVDQLTEYAVDESYFTEGRFGIETLIRGGGDCEDLTILIADIIRSTKYTRNWEIALIILDSDNPL